MNILNFHAFFWYNKPMNTNTQTPKPLVQDRKTGEYYNPEEKMQELMQKNWFVELLKRMKDR